jgi:hypothetical protein
VNQDGVVKFKVEIQKKNHIFLHLKLKKFKDLQTKEEIRRKKKNIRLKLRTNLLLKKIVSMQDKVLQIDQIIS